MKNIEDFFRNKRVMITGGLGFLGSTLTRRLVASGARVLLVDSLIPNYGGNIFNIHDIRNKVTIEIKDLRDSKTIDRFVRNKDFIFNLAGALSHIDSMRDPFTDLGINCTAQLSLLESCRKNNPEVKILFAGTRNQYGKPKYLPVDEKHPLEPTDINGINNMAGEWYHMLYNNVYKLRTVSLRLTNTFGPGHQMKHSRQGVLNWFIRQLIDGKAICLYGGQQKRDVSYVDDVVEAFIMAMASDRTDGEVFNLGGTTLRLKEFVEKAIALYGKGSFKISPMPKAIQAIEVGDYIADYSKIKNLLGWKPKISIEEGLRKTFSYYLRFKKHYW